MGITYSGDKLQELVNVVHAPPSVLGVWLMASALWLLIAFKFQGRKLYCLKYLSIISQRLGCQLCL